MEAASRDYTSRILVATGRAREAVTEAERAIALLATDHPIARMAQASLADALLNCGGPDDTAAALNCVSAAREALLKDPAHFEEPAFILRVHLDALEANGLADEARQAREEARAWVRDRASKIRSEHYRRTVLEGARDVARISTSAVRER
jgi:DNA-binding transcriptional ArsR family regulator